MNFHVNPPCCASLVSSLHHNKFLVFLSVLLKRKIVKRYVKIVNIFITTISSLKFCRNIDLYLTSHYIPFFLENLENTLEKKNKHKIFPFLFEFELWKNTVSILEILFNFFRQGE